MLPVITREVPAHDCGGLRFGHVIGMVEARGLLLAEMPQQLLLGDALRDPAHHAGPHPSERAARHCRAMPALALGIGNHFLEPVDETAEEAARRLVERV